MHNMMVLIRGGGALNIGGSQINILMYVDDLILVSNTTLGLQDS